MGNGTANTYNMLALLFIMDAIKHNNNSNRKANEEKIEQMNAEREKIMKYKLLLCATVAAAASAVRLCNCELIEIKTKIVIFSLCLHSGG